MVNLVAELVSERVLEKVKVIERKRHKRQSPKSWSIVAYICGTMSMHNSGLMNLDCSV